MTRNGIAKAFDTLNDRVEKFAAERDAALVALRLCEEALCQSDVRFSGEQGRRQEDKELAALAAARAVLGKDVA